MSLSLTPWSDEPTLRQGIVDLKAAADRLEKDGWTQYVYSDFGSCCAAGAVNVVTSDGTPSELYDRARKFNSRSSIAMGIFHRMTGGDIATYNDQPGRTAAQVIAKIRKVAQDAEAQLARELAASS